MEFVERAQKFRLKEFTQQLAALTRGFHQFFLPNAAMLFTLWELEILCCGSNDCPIEEVKKVIRSPEKGSLSSHFYASVTLVPRPVSIRYFTCYRVFRDFTMR
jgi:hypothetical protein